MENMVKHETVRKSVFLGLRGIPRNFFTRISGVENDLFLIDQQYGFLRCLYLQVQCVFSDLEASLQDFSCDPHFWL